MDLTMNRSANTAYTKWHELLADPRFAPSSQAIRDYLSLCDGLESPTPYHIWSFLSMTAALCGERVTIEHGPMGNLRLNLGVVLTGVPAVRKSTALTIVQKFAEGLPVSYGPTDTAGQRQGIMSAMLPRWQKEPKDEVNDFEISTEMLSQLAEMDTDSIHAKLPDPVERKASEIYFVSKELGRLIASTSRELFDFFTDGMDGETFHYQLKNQVIKIHKPLMNLLGATTPSSLGNMIPKGGESHGFLSRLIFVHAPHVDKPVPIPLQWSEDQLAIRQSLHDRMMESYLNPHQTLKLSESAEQTYVDLYSYVPATSDIRLSAYAGRRAVHLLKLAGLLAFLRCDPSRTVTAADVRLSHALLVLTEANMERSLSGLDLGFYGRFMCALIELLEMQPDGIVTLQDIQLQLGHLAPKMDLNTLLDSLVVQGKLTAKKNDAWQLQTMHADHSLIQLRTAFTAGGVPSADEYRTHKAGIQGIVKEKGNAG
jgi:hypothetical protein